MTTDETRATITEADVTAFGHKLAAWAAGLTPKDRAILTGALAGSAATESAEVQGYWVRDNFDFGRILIGLVLSSGDRDQDRDHRP